MSWIPVVHGIKKEHFQFAATIDLTAARPAVLDFKSENCLTTFGKGPPPEWMKIHHIRMLEQGLHCAEHQKVA